MTEANKTFLGMTLGNALTMGAMAVTAIYGYATLNAQVGVNESTIIRIETTNHEQHIELKAAGARYEMSIQDIQKNFVADESDLAHIKRQVEELVVLGRANTESINELKLQIVKLGSDE